MRLLIALALALGVSVQAKEVGRASEGNTQARLFDERGECPDKTTRIELWVDGKKAFDGCALDHTDGRVYIIWSDGDRGILQRKLFKPGA
jgi:hypothetical protein